MVRKYRLEIIVVLFVFALLSLQKCNHNKYQQLQGEYKALKEQYQTQKDGVKVIEEARRKEKDSITQENKKLQEKTKNSEKRVAELENNIQKLKKQTQKQKEQIKNMSYVELAQEINKEFSSTEASATNSSVDLKGDLPSKVLEVVYDANECQEVVSIKDEQLKEKDVQIDNTKQELKNTSILLSSAENEIKEKDKLQEFSDKNIKNLEKQNSKLKTKNFFNSYILPPIVFVGGVLVGKNLLK